VNHSEQASVAEMVESFIRFLGKENDVSAYLVNMIPRIIELHRVLAPSGSFFLHCNPAAGHYLKIALDAIFDKSNFLNEIIWSYRRWPSGKGFFQRMHQTIYFYAKDEGNQDRVFNVAYEPRAESTRQRFGDATIVSGWDDGRRVPSGTTDAASPGTPLRDVWDIPRVPPIKMLYETQKPSALLETIIRATTDEGMLVLDPFCGCGTTVVAAHELGRRWVGIDITHLAIRVIEAQLRARFGSGICDDYQVHGVPRDLEGAKDLAQRDKLEFQDWALSLVFGRSLAEREKRHSNGGADGLLRFRPRPAVAIERIVISVKGGEGIHPTDIRDLRGAMESLDAVLGFFITLAEPTDGMRRTAAKCGVYELAITSEKTVTYPKVQILTIEELLNGGGSNILGIP